MESGKKSRPINKLTMQQLADNEEALTRINRKINYSKNPRYLNVQSLKYGDVHTLQSSAVKATATYFRCQPSEIVFLDFQKDMVYEYEVTIVNTSQLIRRIKVSPIDSQDFAVTEIKYPKQDSGDIAPGMSVKITVRFIPKRIDHYQAQLIVLTEDGMFVVPIRSFREEPDLRMQSEVDVGSCWVGRTIQTAFTITNVGGVADFEIESQGAVQNGEELQTGNFSIYPCRFRLKKNQQVQFRIRYSSLLQQSSKKTINIGSECLIDGHFGFSVLGSGFQAHVELNSINGIDVDPLVRQHKIHFKGVIPNQPQTRNVAIKNSTNLPLDYRWELQNVCFSVDNQIGQLQPNETKQVMFTYQSTSYIPDFGTGALYIGSSVKPEYSFEMVASPTRYRVGIVPELYIFPQLLVCKTGYHKEVQLRNDSPSKVPYKVTLVSRSSSILTECLDISGVLQPCSQKKVCFRITVESNDLLQQKAIYRFQFENAQTLYFQMRAKSTLPTVQVSQKLGFGLVKTNSESYSHLQVYNPTQVALGVSIVNKIKYYFPDFQEMYDYSEEDYSSLQKKLWLQKEDFTIQPFQTVNIRCIYWAKGPESLTETLEVVVDGGINRAIDFSIEVQQPHLQLSSLYFNLQQLFVGNTYTLKELSRKQAPLYLMNLGNLATGFTWLDLQSEDCRFQVSPRQGVIEAKSKLAISITVIPLRSRQLNQKIACKFEGTQMQISFEAKIKGLEIKYYLADDSLAKRVLVRETTDFSKTERSRKNPTMSLASTVTYPKQKQKLVYPQLTRVSFFNCEINTPKQVEIALENLSDLDAQFTISLSKYLGQSRQEKVLKPKSALLSDKRAPFSSQMGVALMAKRKLEQSQLGYLQNSPAGVSIVPSALSGEIPKGGEVKMKLTLFNNICGRFSDTLKISVKNHEVREFPVQIQILGTPVCVSKNQLGIDFNSSIPIFRFGTFPTKSGTIRKQFKVVNKGPKPVELVWNIYSLDKPPVSDPFHINICPPQLGSTQPISVKWQANEPPVEEDSLFSIHPKCKQIQAQQQTSFTISFTSLETCGANRCIFVGQPYLQTDSGEKSKMQLMPIISEARTVSPVLRIDKYVSCLLDDSVVNFQKYAGQESQKDCKTLILGNPTEANLICSFQLDNPCFQLLQTSTNSLSNNLLSKPQSQLGTGLNKSLREGTINVRKNFNIAPGANVSLKIQFNSSQENKSDWPLVDKLLKYGKLTVSYSNDDVQQIPLLGQLYRPVIKLNTSGQQQDQPQDVLDFGVVHVKNDRKRTLYLVNPSPVRGKWSLKYIKFPVKRKFQETLWTKLEQQDTQITDDKECFNFSVSEGCLQSLSIPIKTMPNTLALPAPDDNYAKTHVPQKIMISFKPKKNVLYKSKFRIVVQNGEPIEFVVKGQGTYDEQFQK